MPRSPRSEKLEAKRLAYYRLVTETLSRSEDADDRQLARDLTQSFGQLKRSGLASGPAKHDRDRES